MLCGGKGHAEDRGPGVLHAKGPDIGEGKAKCRLQDRHSWSGWSNDPAHQPAVQGGRVRHAQGWSNWAPRTRQCGEAVGGDQDNMWRGGAFGPRAHGNAAVHVVDDLSAEGSGQQKP